MKHNYILILIVTCCYSLISNAQWEYWEQVFEVTDNNFYNLYTPDNQTVWIAGEQGKVYQSQDGGQNFTTTSLETFGFMAAFDFPSSGVGYIGGGCYFTFDECPSNTIYRSTDGGQTWSQILGSTVGFGVIEQIKAVSNDIIYAKSDYEGILKTTNGGATWQTLTIPDIDLVSVSYRNMEFLTEQLGFLYVLGYQPGFQGVQRIYKTTDGGQSWQVVYNKPTSEGGFADFYFTSQNTGYIAASEGRVLKTTNGGQTWETINFGVTDDEPRDIFFVTPDVGYLAAKNTVSGTSRIYKTEDAGTSWFLDLEINDLSIQKLHFSDTENGYAMFDFRKVYRRTGTATPTNNSLDLLLFPNPVVNTFTVELDFIPSEDYVLNLYDGQGRVVKSTQRVFEPVDIEGFATGVYMVEVVKEDGTLVGRGKVVKR